MGLQFTDVHSLPAEAGWENRERIVLLWSLLRNNTVATHLQRFTLNYVSRRCVAWDSWTHTSRQVMQRDSDILIGVSHVHLYFVKRSMSESVEMLPALSLKNPLLVRVWPMCLSVNYTYAGFFSCSIKLSGVLEYVYVSLWKYVLIVKV